MSVIRYNERIGDCTVLGPGTRAVLWVNGCCFDCPGCIGHHYKEGDFLQSTPQQMADWYLGTGAEGLTVSGGEPMLQAGAIAEFVRIVREKEDCGVIVYTGFTIEQLRECAAVDGDVAAFLDQIDLLIDGRYICELDDQRPYVGSSNQRLITLTPRYEDAVRTYYGQATVRQMEIRLSERGTLMMGVPSREQAVAWYAVKRLGDGHEG